PTASPATPPTSPTSTTTSPPPANYPTPTPNHPSERLHHPQVLIAAPCGLLRSRGLAEPGTPFRSPADELDHPHQDAADMEPILQRQNDDLNHGRALPVTDLDPLLTVLAAGKGGQRVLPDPSMPPRGALAAVTPRRDRRRRGGLRMHPPQLGRPGRAHQLLIRGSRRGSLRSHRSLTVAIAQQSTMLPVPPQLAQSLQRLQQWSVITLVAEQIQRFQDHPDPLDPMSRNPVPGDERLRIGPRHLR